MKKATSKLIVFGIIVFSASLTSCKTGSGYGCDYTEIKTPTEIKSNDVIYEEEKKLTYTATRQVAD